jgi:hypothetical protein
MKKILISLLFCTFAIFAKAQTEFYDAINLKKYCKIENGILKINPKGKQTDTVITILHKYFDKIDTSLVAKKVGEYLRENPFFSNTNYTGTTEGVKKKSYVNYSSYLSSIGNFDITNTADGITKFLIDHLKTELSAAFFDKFKEELNDSNHIELKVLFPETIKTLNTIDQDIYMYSNYLNTLREAFIKDMTSEFVNLEKLLNEKKYQNYFDDEPELGSIIKTSLYFINGISAGKHPGKVFAEFNAKGKIDFKNSNVEQDIIGSIETMQLLSESFRSKSKINYWVSPDSIQDLVQDSIAFKIYLGLIYQKAKNEDKKYIFSNNSLVTILDSIASNFDKNIAAINEYKDFIEKFINKAQEVNELITEIKGKKRSEIDCNDYYKLFGASLDLLDQVPDFIDLPYVDLGDKEKEVKNKVGTVLYIARTSGELYVDTKTKNYSSAIMNSIMILDTVIRYNSATLDELFCQMKTKFIGNNNLNCSDKEAIIKKIQKFKFKDITLKNAGEIFTKEFNDDKYKLCKSEIEELIKIHKKFLISKQKEALKKSLLKYGSFIAAMAQAETSDDVKNVIESAALPAGSYSIKQKCRGSWFVNGYMGYAWDINNIKALNNVDLYLHGIYAPIGVSTNFAICKNKNHKGGAFTIFGSFIDVGGLAAYRLTNSTDTLKQQIKLQSIISPSLQVMWEIPKTPFNLCLGWRMTPILYYSGNSTFETIQSKHVFNVSLLVDIPIFTIKTW